LAIFIHGKEEEATLTRSLLIWLAVSFIFALIPLLLNDIEF